MGVRPFVCFVPDCNAAYVRRYTLRRHVLEAHRLDPESPEVEAALFKCRDNAQLRARLDQALRAQARASGDN